MSVPKTVQLYLIDGTPAGRIKCSLTNWTGIVYLIPRTYLNDSTTRSDLNQSGVYILLGNDDETGASQMYVGQGIQRKNGKGVLGRIFEHIGSEQNDYFTHAIIIVTSNDSFGPTEVSYLENAFYNLGLKAGRTNLTNSNYPSPGHVTEEKQAELDEFIAFSKIAIGSLGYRLFEAVDDRQETLQNIVPTNEGADEPLLYLDAAGIRATGRQTSEGFVVLAGSKLRPQVNPSAPDTVRANRARFKERITPEFELMRDTLFSSPSSASNFLMGASTNGRIVWKDTAGMNLRDLEGQVKNN